jgi:hypothetical protein
MSRVFDRYRSRLVVTLLLVGAPAQAATIGLNFTGVRLGNGILLTGGGYAPPDNDGAVGPNQVVQLINGAFAVYDKTTGALMQPLISGRAFWSNAGIDPGTGPGTTNVGAFNQRILYDPSSDRWFAAALSGQNTDNNVLLARSDTSNPLGTWKAVSFLGNNGGDAKFADYTRLGVDANGVYIATDDFTAGNGGFDSQSIYSLPKADLLAANPTLARLSQFHQIDAGFNGMTIQPIVNFGPSTGHAPLLGTSAANIDTVLLRSDLTGTGGANAVLSTGPSITVMEYSQNPMAAQPDGTRSINTLDDRIGATVYQVGHMIYAVHQTQVGGNVAIHWVKIDEQSNQVVQEGILSNPAFDYSFPSIAVNANGDIVIGFTRSGFGSDGNLTAAAVVGKTVNGNVTFGDPFVLKASTVNNYHFLNGRWGDYSSTVVDPSNPNAFWTFQEYALTSNAWATQVTEIFVPEPGTAELAALSLVILCFSAWRVRRARAH